MTTLIKFLIIFSSLIVFLLFAGKNPNISWLSLPIVIIVQLLTMMALGSMLAAIVPFIPDIKLLIDNGLMLLFFLSGVFFDINLVPGDIKKYFYLNPMVSIIESYRMILLDGTEPNWYRLGLVAITALGGLALSGHLLRRYDGTYAKVI
jgi:lipopolysaccharide transport system permease protein